MFYNNVLPFRGLINLQIVPVSGTVLGNSVKLQNTLVDQSLLSLDLPGDMLAPGASVRIPVMIRAEDIGTHNCKFVFGYLGTDDAASKLRVFRYTRILQVVPSLHVSVVTKPSAKKNAEFILGLEVTAVFS